MKRVIITGSCGFIGSCLTLRLLNMGVEVIGIDNLSRPGSESNAIELGNPLFHLYKIDISNTAKVFDLFSKLDNIDALFHLAAQVAVTTSYVDRKRDFQDNALASFNVIEAVKRYIPDTYCLYASTNKVYGNIIVEEPVGCESPLNPYTPYGVSKAVGELYFLEYGRDEIGLSTCSLRQSCIYGERQYGVEDQGWIAWFAIANVLGLPITIYGNGTQIRDLLFIDDLIDLYLECVEKRLTNVYPIGGGPSNTISLKEAIELIAELAGNEFRQIHYGQLRAGDQPYFVADLSWLDKTPLSWKPQTGIRQGIQKMFKWIRLNENKIRSVLKL